MALSEFKNSPVLTDLQIQASKTFKGKVSCYKVDKGDLSLATGRDLEYQFSNLGIF